MSEPVDITSAQMDALQDTTKPKDYAQMWTDGGGDPTFHQIDGFLQAHYGGRAVWGDALNALRHLFFVIQRLDRQADGSGHMVQVSAEAWKDLVRPAIRAVEQALERGSSR